MTAPEDWQDPKPERTDGFTKPTQPCEPMRHDADPGRKFDAGKPRFSLVPLDALDSVVRVLEYGANKYSPDNWRKVPDLRTRYFDATMRHVLAWRRGEAVDAETGEHHLAHAACCILFLLADEVSP